MPTYLDALLACLTSGDAVELRSLLLALPPGDDARLVSRLQESDQERLLQLLPHEDAAALLKEFSPSQAAGLLQRLPAELAAALLELFPSNEQADLVALLGADATEIIGALPTETADRVRRLVTYPPDTAGGLMIGEFLAYPVTALVSDVIADLRRQAEKYARMQVQYAYVADLGGRLVGVLRLRDLLLLDPDRPIVDAMTSNPQRVLATATLEDLLHRFDRRAYFGLPVVDGNDRLVGVVLRADAEEAAGDRDAQVMLVTSGVLGGEEYRSMSFGSRILRRAPWLVVSLILSLLAASVIGLYEETLSTFIVLAIFLPVVSGMGGNAGNQSLAVSIRELSLGLVEPHEYLWVVLKEISVGLANGLGLGILIGLVAYVAQRNARLSVVVGAAIASTMLISACLGGIIPLLLKRWRLDPALASGPVLAAITDLCGFLITLTLANTLLLYE